MFRQDWLSGQPVASSSRQSPARTRSLATADSSRRYQAASSASAGSSGCRARNTGGRTLRPSNCPWCQSVEPGSAASQAGLRADDVIVGANRGRVDSLRELHERAKGATVLVLEVRRGNTVILIPLR